MSTELTEWRCANGPECQAGCLRCFETALRAQIAAEIENVSLDLTFESDAYGRGFWLALDHARRIAEGVTDEH